MCEKADPKIQKRSQSEKTKEAKLDKFNALSEEDKRKQESRKLKKQIATEQIDLLKPTILSYINNTFELQDFKYTNGDYSISHILNYSIDTIVTNYKTNVTTHFDKYVKKFVYCTLLKLLKEPSIPKYKKKNTNPDPCIGSDKDLKKWLGR